MVISTPITLTSYNEEVTAPVTGTFQATDTELSFETADGRKVAIECDENGLRVHVWTPNVDAPVSMAIVEDTITLNTRDFTEEDGILKDAYS